MKLYCYENKFIMDDGLLVRKGEKLTKAEFLITLDQLL